MSWIYKGNKLTTDVQKDTSTKGRWTFNRQYYFQPAEYADWSTKKDFNTDSYSAELVSNVNIPTEGTSCQIAGLGAFYVNDILSIQNMSKQDNPDATSWARVIVEYQNKQEAGSYSYDSGDKKPWQQNVKDFSIVLQETSRPMLSGYNIDNSWAAQNLQTKAGQKIYNVQTPYYTFKASWTLNDRSTNYSTKFDKPYINQQEVNLFGKIKIPAKHGLIFPPGYRQLYYNSGKGNNETAYDQWTFEVLIDFLQIPGAVKLANAGTKALRVANNKSTAYDICKWYSVQASQSAASLQLHHGNFQQLWDEHQRVAKLNQSIEDPLKQWRFQGDFVSNQLPLRKDGTLAWVQLEGFANLNYLNFSRYQKMTWGLNNGYGMRW